MKERLFWADTWAWAVPDNRSCNADEVIVCEIHTDLGMKAKAPC